MGTTMGTPNVLAALATADGREPLASDLGVREAAADSPVLPLPPIVCDGLHPRIAGPVSISRKQRKQSRRLPS